MSALSEALNDIKGPEDTYELAEQPVVKLEEEPKKPLVLSEESLEVLTSSIRLSRLKNSLMEFKVVDKGVALEAIALAEVNKPELVKAKLTGAASQINKEVLMGLKIDSSEAEAEYGVYSKDVYREAQTWLPKAEVILDELKVLASKLKGELEDKNAIIVIVNKESIRLLERCIVEVSNLDMRDIGYEDYEGEKLTSLYKELVSALNCSSLKKLFDVEGREPVTVRTLVDGIDKLLVPMVTEIISNLKTLTEEEGHELTEEYIGLTRTAVEELETLEGIEGSLGENGLYRKLEKLISFLN